MTSTREDIVSPAIKEKIAASTLLTEQDIQESEESMEGFLEEAEFIQALLPHILGRMMMDSRFEPNGFRPNAPLIIPIILDGPLSANEDPFLAALYNTPNSGQENDSVNEAQKPEGNVCLRALKSMCNK